MRARFIAIGSVLIATLGAAASEAATLPFSAALTVSVDWFGDTLNRLDDERGHGDLGRHGRGSSPSGRHALDWRDDRGLAPDLRE